MEKNNYITPQGHQKLLDELNQLKKIERPEVTKLVQWAASNGDRSENADYLYGKRRLREIDRRLRFLSKRLDAAKVIDPLSIKSEKIQFGATVRLSDENEKPKTVIIVGVDEVDTVKGKLSWQSPMGQALLGKSLGDEVLVRAPQGELTFVVEDIIYQSIE